MHIAISGRMRSGKDTAALVIVRNLLEKSERGELMRIPHHCSLGNPLYDLVRNLEQSHIPYDVAYRFLRESQQLGLQIDAFHDPSTYVKQLTECYAGQGINGKNRLLLREVGEYMREVNEATWVARFLQTRRSLFESHSLIVSDLRHPFDADRLRAEGFLILRIDVDPTVQRERLEALGEPYDPAVIEHQNETRMDDYPFDVRIPNNEDLPQLEARLSELLDRWVHAPRRHVALA